MLCQTERFEFKESWTDDLHKEVILAKEQLDTSLIKVVGRGKQKKYTLI